MSLPQHLRFGQGGTVYVDDKDLPQAATVSILDGAGVVQLEHTAATLSLINTALNCAPSAGDRSINVLSNVDMVADQTFWLQDVPEEVLVLKRDGETITLRRPLMHDHVNSAVVEGSRISLVVDPTEHAVTNVLFWDGHCEWNIDGRTTMTSVECTKYPLNRLASTQDLFDVEPKLYDILDTEQSSERLLDLAHEHVLMLISLAAPDTRVRVYAGSMAFRHATALAALYLHYRRRRGPDAAEAALGYKNDLKEVLSAVCVTTPRDSDQDKVIEEHERISFRSVPVKRK